MLTVSESLTSPAQLPSCGRPWRDAHVHKAELQRDVTRHVGAVGRVDEIDPRARRGRMAPRWAASRPKTRPAATCKSNCRLSLTSLKSGT